MIRTILCALVVLVLAASASGGAVIRNLEYANVDGNSLKLDLYLPDRSEREPLPLVVWVHGGGWRAGSRAPTQAPRLLGEGYIVASIDYRLSQQAIFPAQIHDCKGAIRWLRAHAGEYGIDPDRIGVWGSSAGGHLASLLGTSSNLPELEGAVGEHLDQSSAVQAVCGFYGPTDLTAMIDQPSATDHGAPDSPEGLLLGGAVADRPELSAMASPVTHVDPSDPPFLLVHGDADPTVPYEQSVLLHRALAEAGVDATLHLVGRAGHGGFPPEVNLLVKAFFDRTLADS